MYSLGGIGGRVIQSVTSFLSIIRFETQYISIFHSKFLEVHQSYKYWNRPREFPFVAVNIHIKCVIMENFQKRRAIITTDRHLGGDENNERVPRLSVICSSDYVLSFKPQNVQWSRDFVYPYFIDVETKAMWSYVLGQTGKKGQSNILIQALQF